jgi:hypothetical protein
LSSTGQPRYDDNADAALFEEESFVEEVMFADCGYNIELGTHINVNPTCTLIVAGLIDVTAHTW